MKQVNGRQVVWDEELHKTACAYHDGEFSEELLKELYAHDELRLAHEGDVLRTDDAGTFLEGRKRQEIERLLHSVRVGGKSPTRVEVDMSGGHTDLIHEDEIFAEQACQFEFPAVSADGQIAYVGFGVDVGDRWYVAHGTAYFD